MADEFLSVPQAAAELGLTPRAVLVRIQNGRLPAVRIGGRWAITREDLAAQDARGTRRRAS